MAEETTAVDKDDQIVLFKDYLAEPRFRIKLDDLVNASVHDALRELGSEQFPLRTGRIVPEDFSSRLKGYEEVMRPLLLKAALLGRWATSEQVPTLANMLARVSDNCPENPHGDSFWLSMRLYPISLMLYSAGIGALTSDNYAALAAIFTKQIIPRTKRSGGGRTNLIVSAVDSMRDVIETNIWGSMEGYSNKRTPDNEYAFATLREPLDGLLFLGARYDQLFDRFEILRTLVYADVTDNSRGRSVDSRGNTIPEAAWKAPTRMSALRLHNRATSGDRSRPGCSVARARGSSRWPRSSKRNSSANCLGTVE